MDQTITPFGFEFPAQAQSSLDAFYAICGTTKLVWIVSPITQYMRDKFMGELKMHSFFVAQRDKQNARSVSFVEEKQYVRDFFADHRHLNVMGADIFSRLVKEFVEK